VTYAPRVPRGASIVAASLAVVFAAAACAHAELSLPESSGRTEDDGPPPPPTAPRVVFARVDDGSGHAAYTPTVCYEAARHTVLAGAGCADLVPPGAELRCVGAAGKVVVGARTTAACARDATDVEPWPAFPVTGPGVACDVAVWSQDSGPEVIVVPRVAPRVGPQEQLALKGRIQQVYPDATEPVQVAQAVSLDLDADGAKDRLLAVSVAGAPLAVDDAGVAPSTAPSMLAFSGVALTYASAPSDVVLVHRDPRLRWRLRAVMDVDSDGTPELWFTAWSAAAGGADLPSPAAPHVEIVERIAAGRPLRLGSLDCMVNAPP